MKERARESHIFQDLTLHTTHMWGNFKQEHAMFLSTDDRYTTARAVKHTAGTVQKAVMT
jgi:hypothetical protein